MSGVYETEVTQIVPSLLLAGHWLYRVRRDGALVFAGVAATEAVAQIHAQTVVRAIETGEWK